MPRSSGCENRGRVGLHTLGANTEEALTKVHRSTELLCGQPPLSLLRLCQLSRSDMGTLRDLPLVPRHEVIAPGPMTSYCRRRAKQVWGGASESRAPWGVGLMF